MPRRLKIATAEMGYLELYLIYQAGDDYEAEWAPLQGSPLADLFTVVPKEVLDHALHGFTRPFVKALGLGPVGCLRKLPVALRQCAHQSDCQFYSKSDCFPTAKKLPNCFEPDGVEGTMQRQLGHDVLLCWREGVWVVVVRS